MNTKAAASPLRLLGDLLLKWDGWVPLPITSVFFFGDYERPKKEDYNEL